MSLTKCSMRCHQTKRSNGCASKYARVAADDFLSDRSGLGGVVLHGAAYRQSRTRTNEQRKLSIGPWLLTGPESARNHRLDLGAYVARIHVGPLMRRIPE